MQGDDFERRRETAYESAPSTFARLAKAFGLPVDHKTHERLCALFDASVLVDRHFDDPRSDQHTLLRAIPSFLEGNTTDQDHLPNEIRQALRTLMECVLHPGNTPEFVGCVRGVLQRGMLMHTTTDTRAYIAAAEEEGELAGDMIAIAIGNNQEAWRNFLRDLITGVTVLDKICDAKHDKANGEIALEPSGYFYRQAWTVFARRMSRAFLEYPNKLCAFCRLLKLLNWYRHCR